MRAYRKVVKDWLRLVDREELSAMLQSAIFTPDELRYIHKRLIEGKSFKLIAIDEGLSKSGMAKIADRVAQKMYKAIQKEENENVWQDGICLHLNGDFLNESVEMQ